MLEVGYIIKSLHLDNKLNNGAYWSNVMTAPIQMFLVSGVLD